MPRSIDSHRPDCSCPPCRFRRGEDKGQKPHFGIRLDPEIRDHIKAAPEGPGPYVERLVREDIERQHEGDAPQL